MAANFRVKLYRRLPDSQKLQFLKMMRFFLSIFAGAVIGAVLTTLAAFASARPFWPPEIGFGRNPNDYFLFFSLTISVGAVLGIDSGFAVASSSVSRLVAARLLIIVGILVAVLIVPITWLLEDRGAWPLLHASDMSTAMLEDFGPFIICWFPLLWAILLTVRGLRESSRNSA